VVELLIESAFSMLPEFVAGYGFQKVRREANAVSCFSFSLLNALHSKNVLDPIQRMQLEKHYASGACPLPVGGTNRHCDVFLDYGGSKIGTAALANYGWRYRNYVEAKFLKSSKRTSTGQDTKAFSNSAEAVADLLRLVALVPEPEAHANKPGAKTSSARYFLCLSDNSPDIFVLKYLRDLLCIFKTPAAGMSLEVDLTHGKPSGAFAKKIGAQFDKIKLRLNGVTCFSHYPLNAALQNPVWMLMLRIDAASVELDDNGVKRSYSINSDRSLSQGAPGDYSRIRDFIAVNIN
jgi:hypothetical protein